MLTLTELSDAQRAAKTLFLGVSKRYFCRRLAFESVDWEKRSTLTRVDGHHPIYWGPNKPNGKQRANSLSPWFGTFIFSCPQTSELLILWPSDLNWIKPLAFLVLQLLDSISSDVIASIIIWANSHDKSPLMYLYISYWFCWRILTNPLLFMQHFIVQSKFWISFSVQGEVIERFYWEGVSHDLNSFYFLTYWSLCTEWTKTAKNGSLETN